MDLLVRGNPKKLKTKAMKTQITIKGLGLLAILFLLVPLSLSLYGRTNVEKVMREFQARYHYINPGFYIWPDCYGGPAPSYI